MAKFTKGKSGNPGGRPKGIEGLRACLAKKFGDDGSKLADKLEELVNSRNPKVALPAVELSLVYLVGKAKDTIELTGSIDPLRIIITDGAAE